MAIKPILFNSHMVDAILDGRKTVTRRVVKGSENYSEFCGLKTDPDMLAIAKSGEEYPKRVKGLWAIFEQDGLPQFPMAKAPYDPEDVLWVRETWAQVDGVYYYRADDKENLGVFGGWCPSIQMPREAARIWLRVTNVRVERLHEMHEEDVRREGFENPGDFVRLWDSTIKPADCGRYGWEANPWVCVIGFERCEKPEQCDDYGRSDDQGAIGV